MHLCRWPSPERAEASGPRHEERGHVGAGQNRDRNPSAPPRLQEVRGGLLRPRGGTRQAQELHHGPVDEALRAVRCRRLRQDRNVS